MYKLKYLIVAGLFISIGSATAAEGWEESSNSQYFGIGGWRQGRACPSSELVWKAHKGEDWVTTFFKSKDGKTKKLGQGIAIFSPDCQLFWFVSFDKQETISIFETTNGNKVTEIPGRYPAWSPDSQSIIVSRKVKLYQLWSVPIDRRSVEKMIFQVTDHDECGVIGDSIDWHPVTFVTDNKVKWVYSIKTDSGADPASFSKPAKSLLIDIAKKSLVMSESATLACSF